MPRKKKQYNFIYRTTCKINNKYYIGMHSTDNLDDGYIGSGKKLWRYIRKYGRDSFDFEILEFLPDRKSLVAREHEIVNEQTINDKMCLNIAIGGSGGFRSENHRKKFLRAAKSAREKMLKDPNHRKFITEKLLQYTIENHKKGLYPPPPNWLGKKHKEESKVKISNAMVGKGLGDKNSQYGTKWITDGNTNKKIPSNMELPIGWKYGRINGNIKTKYVPLA
jgi:group I intron endonuclease